MRLMHTKTYQLATFFNDVPQYAILSHTWGDGEVLFKDIGDAKAREKMKGWQKIVGCCRRASEDGWDYVWIDTCCIDKTDSTELSEAINSMFRWYEEAQICYAYLADVPSPIYHGISAGRRSWWSYHLRRSRWFTRGWTLQELLAPAFLLFVDGSWGVIGSKEEWAANIQEITGIKIKQLLDFRQCSVATKLSWAARRQTTREEDRAYSLLGLLGVNMPLIYGEGRRAFTRLQHELIRSYNDETILVWGTIPVNKFSLPTGFRNKTLGILGPWPELFAHSNGLVAWPFDKQRRGFALTNAGLSINAELFELPGQALYAIQLNCMWASTRRPVALFLTSAEPGDNPSEAPTVFRRVRTELRHWGELTDVRHRLLLRSLGRHDLLLEEEHGSTAPAPVVSHFATLEAIGGLSFEPSSALVCFRFLNERWGCTDRRSPGQSVPRAFRISAFQAVVLSLSLRNGGGEAAERVFAVVLKWTWRGLSAGIWPSFSVTFGHEDSVTNFLESDEAVIKLLESDQAKPYPLSAQYDDDYIVRIATMPRPGQKPLEGRTAVRISVEVLEPEEDPPLVLQLSELLLSGPEAFFW